MTDTRYVVQVTDDGYMAIATTDTLKDEIWIANSYTKPSFIFNYKVVNFDQVDVWVKKPLPESVQVDGEFYYVLNGVY